MSAAWWWKRFSRGRGRKKSSCFTQMDVVCEDIAELSPRSDNIWFYTEGDTLPCKRFGNYISNYLLEGALETLAQLHQGWHWKELVNYRLMLFESMSLSHIESFDISNRGPLRFQSSHSWFGEVERKYTAWVWKTWGLRSKPQFWNGANSTDYKETKPCVFKVPTNAWRKPGFE